MLSRCRSLRQHEFSFRGADRFHLQILIIGVAVILMTGLDFLIRKTMNRREQFLRRATVPLMECQSIGSFHWRFHWAARAALGNALRSCLSCYLRSMGILVGWKAFVAAVIGGIGSIRGAVLGGFLLGTVEVMSVAFLPSTYRDLISYSLLLVILIFKPYGLLGSAPNQKV
jgi:branched-chain amino acid transport system permease protein